MFLLILCLGEDEIIRWFGCTVFEWIHYLDVIMGTWIQCFWKINFDFKIIFEFSIFLRGIMSFYIFVYDISSFVCGKEGLQNGLSSSISPTYHLILKPPCFHYRETSKKKSTTTKIIPRIQYRIFVYWFTLVTLTVTYITHNFLNTSVPGVCQYLF